MAPLGMGGGEVKGPDKAGEASVQDLVEAAGAGWFQVSIFAPLLGITVIECGQCQIMNSINSALQHEWSLTVDDTAALPSLALVGLAFGTFMSGVNTDMLGRRTAILIGFGSACITSVACACAFSYRMMCVLFVLNGIAAALGITAGYVMIAEVCPSSIRGVGFILPLVAQSFGEVYSVAAMDWFMPDLVHGSWRSVVLCCSLPCWLFFFLGLKILPESPVWLAVQGRAEESRRVVLRMARENKRLEEVEALEKTVDWSAEARQTTRDEPFMTEFVQVFSSPRIQLLTLAFGFLLFTGQLVTIGMSFFWPELLQSQIFNGCSFTRATALGLIRCCGVPSAVAMLPIIRSGVGHRWVLAICSFSVAWMLMMTTQCMHHSTADLVLVIAGTSLLPFNLMYTAAILFMTESFPTKVRAVGSATCMTLGRFGAFTGPALLTELGFHGFLSFVSGVALVSIIVTFMLAETKGKHMKS